LNKLQFFCSDKAPEAQHEQRSFKPPACRQAGSNEIMAKKMHFRRLEIIGDTPFIKG